MNEHVKRFDWRVVAAAVALAIALPALASLIGYHHRGGSGWTILSGWAKNACILGCLLGAIGLASLLAWSLSHKQWISALLVGLLLVLSHLITMTRAISSSNIHLSESKLEGADEMTYRVMSYGFMDISHSLVREVARDPVFVTVEKVAAEAPLSDDCQMLDDGDSLRAPGLLATTDRRVIMLNLEDQRCVQAAFDIESQTAWGGRTRSIHDLPPNILSSHGAIDTVVPRPPTLRAPDFPTD